MVSVIIPVYNSEKYIEKCLKSVIGQTYKDTEIIVIDDGSKDDTGKICDSFRQDNIRVFHQENQGVSVARNKGLEEAKGEFIMFVDGDDYLEIEAIEQLLKGMDERTDIVSCCCKTTGEEPVFEDHFFDGDRIYENDLDKEELFLQLIDPKNGKKSERTVTAIGVPWGKLYRRNFIEKNNLRFDPKLRRLQDNVFNMYAFAKADKLVYLDRPLYNYRIDHIQSFYSGYRNPANTEKVIRERKKFFSQNRKLYSYEVERVFDRYVYKSFITGLKYYASRSNMYNKNIRRGFIRMINNRVYSKQLFLEYTDKLLHERIIDLLIKYRMLLLLYGILRFTL